MVIFFYALNKSKNKIRMSEKEDFIARRGLFEWKKHIHHIKIWNKYRIRLYPYQQRFQNRALNK
jgi:hypothetical protein